MIGKRRVVSALERLVGNQEPTNSEARIGLGFLLSAGPLEMDTRCILRNVLLPCPPRELVLYLVTMEIDSITILARKLLNTTYQLVMGPNTYKSLFARVIEGTLRRDYLTLYTMLYLTEHDKPEARRAFGSSCMDLCRRVLEDLISLEYMILKGKEAYAKKFFEYVAIEAKHDMDFLEAVGAPIDQQLKATVDEKFNSIKRKFLDSSGRARRKAWTELTEFLSSQGKIDQQTEHEILEEFNRRYPDVNEQPRRAWAGLDTEAMIEVLVNGGAINTKEQETLIQTYIQGNRKNHFSPTDISGFLYSNPNNEISNADLALSLTATTTSVTRMARIFADEFDVSEDTKQALEEIWQSIFTAHLSEEG